MKMARLLLALSSIVLLQLVWQQVNSQTLDQIIQSSMASSDSAGFMQDDGGVMVEMDMRFKAEDWARIQRDNERSGSGRKKRKATAYTRHRWTNKIIPYQLYNVFSSRDIAQINAAIADWQRYTCLTFRRRSNERNYIYLHSGGGCSSYVGMVGGAQAVSLAPGCRVKGIIIHELGHALGFQHEQTRPDRDRYVRILTQNIQRGVEFNFQRYSTSVVNNYNVPYDYTSIMHYGQYAFSANGRPTIQTLDSSKQHLIGNRHSLSFSDIKLANIIYSCGERCGNKRCPSQGYLAEDCKCYCPGNPIRECSGDGGGSSEEEGEGGDCVDDHQNCGTWAANGECTRNPTWMLVNCKLSCDRCEGGVGTTPAPPPCRDTKQYCGYWSRYGYCRRNSRYYNYMRQNCPRTCGLCTRRASSAASNCTDSNSSCQYWSQIGECRRNPNYMLTNCKRSCNNC